MLRVVKLLPELQGREMTHIQSVIKDMSDEDAESFAHIYRARRKDPQIVLIMSIIGLFMVPGLQRFYLNQIGMGILFLFTVGLCFVGSIIDLVDYENMTQKYNTSVVNEILYMLKQ